MPRIKLVLPLFLLLILAPGFALRGVGLQYGTTAQIVQEGKQVCIPYGIYNPWDEDVYIKLIQTGELANFSSSSKSTLVVAKTFHDKALPISICFDIPKIYKKDCTLLLACERKCPENLTEYNGLIMAVEDRTGGISGSGSATSVSATAPLKLVVSCTPEAKNWIPLGAFILAIIVIVFVIIRIKLIRSKRKRRRKK
jgi:hypothetical protein